MIESRQIFFGAPQDYRTAIRRQRAYYKAVYEKRSEPYSHTKFMRYQREIVSNALRITDADMKKLTPDEQEAVRYYRKAYL